MVNGKKHRSVIRRPYAIVRSVLTIGSSPALKSETRPMWRSTVSETNREFIYGEGVGYCGLGAKLFAAASALVPSDMEWREQLIHLCDIGNSRSSVAQRNLFLSSNHIGEGFADEVIDGICDCLPLSNSTTKFWWNCQRQLPVLRETFLRFFRNREFTDPVPGHVEFSPVRLAFCSTLRLRGRTMDVVSDQPQVIGTVRREIYDEQISLGPPWARFPLPLADVEFERGSQARRSSTVMRQSLKRKMILEPQRRLDASSQLNFGCGLIQSDEQQLDGVFQPHFDRAVRDIDGHLLYFQNYSIALTRYLPPPKGSKVFRVQRLNWDFDPETGKTCGITFTSSNGLDSHVMIPGLLDWLEKTSSSVLRRNQL